MLPVGVTYVPGSTSPAGLGEPAVFTSAGQQTLVWNNSSDLPIGASQGLTFSATPSAATFPVGSTVSNAATVYAQSAPRTVVKFGATGVVTPGSYSETATSPVATTTISALAIAKSEPSPEHELLRGVHDQSTLYTVKVTNNGSQPTNGVLVTDYLPAQLEFLGCGTVDNTSGATVEYPGAPRLDAVPDVPSCITATSVDTVVLAAGNPQGLPAGVYTAVTWNLGNLAAGGTRSIVYRAGIPQRANVAFGTGGPTPASLGQAANLDNNTGASTRETTSEQALTNTATATGVYQGPVASGTSTTVSARDQVTVTSEDLALQKSVSPGTFSAGGIATYTMKIEAGEYTEDSSIVVTDVLPDGLCPLDSTTNHAPGAPAECAAVVGSDPTGADFATVTSNPDGTYTIVFTPLPSLAHNATATITFKARMRATYVGSGADPTVSGDSYTNRVSLVGTTSVRAGVNPPEGSVQTDVRDASSAALSSDAPRLSKTIKPTTTPYDCADTGTYTDNDTLPSNTAALTYREGDRVCFRLRVDFSTVNSTKDAVLTDFLPSYLTYDAGSATLTSKNTVTAVFDASTFTWRLGDPSGSSRFVAPGGVFETTLSGIVTAPPSGPAPDITANLAKLRWVNTGGDVGFLRDQVDFSVAAAPPVGITKTATRGGSPVASNGSVRGGDVLVYGVNVTNKGTSANRNDVPMVGPDVWDVLPAGVPCSQISVISDGGACTDPGDAGHPTFASRNTRSAIRWNLPDSVTIAPGATRTLTFTWTAPVTPRVATSWSNSVSVSSYATDTNLQTLAQHHPASNVDTTVTAGQVDTAAATATHAVSTPPVAVTKTVTSDVVPPADANNSASQAVIGEGVTWTVTTTVPARSTVYDGTLTDTMPTGITLLSAAAQYSADNGATFGALPSGVVLTTTPGTGGSGVLTLPATYVNGTDVAQVFRVVVDARVATLAGNAQGVGRANVASFTENQTPGGTAMGAVSATATVTVVEPAPTLAKSASTTTPSAGEVVTYTLTATNASGRPILHDSTVVDCLPAGLVFGAFASVPGGTSTDSQPGDGTNGCPSGTTRLLWTIGDIVAGSDRVLTYTATVAPASAGAQAYTNLANLSGSSMADGTATPTATERAYTTGATATVTVKPATISKTTSTPTRPIGSVASFTVTAVIPANVNFYDAAVFDTLPAGLDPASIQLTGSSCAPSCAIAPVALTTVGPTVGWSLGDLTAAPQARTVALDYTAVVRDIPGNAHTAVLTNQARLGWDVADGPDKTSASDPTDRTTATSSATVTIVEPNLTIAKSASTGTPVPGQTFGYTLTLANTRSGVSAYAVKVTDAVPSGVVVDASSISAGGTIVGATAAGGGTITWQLAGPLDLGSPTVLTYQAKLASPTPSSALTNTAQIAGYTSLAGGSGRQYTGPSATATVQAALPRVVVAKAVVGGPVAYLGQPKAWSITVTNANPVTAYGVDVVDTLPPNWTYRAGSAAVSVNGGTPGAVEPTTTTSGAVQTLSWADLADLTAKDQTIVVTFEAIPGPGVVTAPGVGSAVAQTNTASTTAEDANGNQQSTDGTAFNGPPATAAARIDSADLRITKSPNGTPVAGQPFSWALTVDNLGGDAAVGPITVVDPYPSQLGSAVATGTGWSCTTDPTASTATCTRPGPLAANASLPVITVTGNLAADLPAGTSMTNTASVGASTYDPTTGNNSASSQVTTTASADLSMTKAQTGPFEAGSPATYTLTVTNNGPSTHSGAVRVTDAVPTGTTYVSATGTGWTCGEATGTISCTRADLLGLGAAPVITVVVAVDASRTSAVTNSAVVIGGQGGGTPDPNPDNDTGTVTRTPTTAADVSVDKESLRTFTPGRNGTYRFTVHNAGPSDAAGIVLRDTLPDGLTYGSARSVSGTWSCSAAGQDVTCTLGGTLADGADAVVEVMVAIDAARTGDIANTVVVSTTTTQPPGTTSNDTDTDHTDPAAEADLTVGKSHPAGPVVAGTDVTYTLSVHNNGPSVSPGPISVTDTLPAGLTCVSIDDGACPDGDLVASRSSSLAPGATWTVTVVAHVSASAEPGTVTNRVAVSGPVDTDPTNDIASDPTEVVTRANVRVTKTVTGPDPVAAGARTTFRVRVHNDGPSDASAVSVADVVPAGMTLVSVTGSGWTCDEAAGTCQRATLAAGADSDLTVTVAVASGVAAATTLTNAVSVAAATAGDDPDDNTSSASVGVVTSADLSLVKSHPGASEVAAGTDTTYHLDVADAGPSDVAGALTVTDTLPAGLTFLSGTGTGWTCAADGQAVTCTYADGLVSGASAPRITLLVHVDADRDAGTVTNTARVSSDTPDPVPTNDTDTAQLSVVRLSTLKVTKSHTGPVVIGGTTTFSIVVHNDGPATARSVQVADELPTGLVLESVDGGSAWSCATGSTVDCTLDAPLAPGADAPAIAVATRVDAAAYPSVTNTATVTSANAPAATGTDTVTVPAQVDLTVGKSHTGRFAVGEQGHYRLVVTNTGPTPEPGAVTVTDTLPAGLTAVSAGADGWTCSAAGAAITCSTDGLAVGQRAVIDVVVQVGPAAYPSVTNTASVTGPSQDTDPANNADSDDAAVTPLARLVLDKSVLRHSATSATWRLRVTNDGPNATTGRITLVDVLPTSLHLTSATGTGWACADVGQRLTCTTDAVLPAGRSTQVDVVTDIVPGTTAAVRNVATVAGGVTGAPSSSTDDATVEVLSSRPGTRPGGALAFTGGVPWFLAGLGVLFVAAGTGLLRRRRLL